MEALVKQIVFFVCCGLWFAGCYLEVPLQRTNPLDPQYTGPLVTACQSDKDCRNNEVCNNKVCGPKLCHSYRFQKSVANQNFENTSDGQVLAAAFHPNGKLLVTGSENGTVKVWKYPELTLERVLKGHTLRVNSLSFNLSGKFMASASDDKTIIIWNAETGVQEIQLTGHSDIVTSVDFQGIKYLISGSRDGTVRFWDVANKREARTSLTIASEVVNGVSRSPNGTMLAAVTEHPTTRVSKVLLWKLQDLSVTSLPPDTSVGAGIFHNSVIYDMAWSPDSTQIVTSPDSEAVTIWSASTQKRVRELVVPENEKPQLGLMGHPYAAAWSRNGVHIAVSSSSGRIVIWDAQTGKNLFTLTDMAFGAMPDLTFSRDGLVLAAASTQPSLGSWQCVLP